VACFTVIGGLVLLNLLVTMGFTLAITRIVQDLPKPNDVKAQADLYTAFRDRIEQVSPLPLDKNYFPEQAEDSAIFQYIRQTLQGPFVPEALLKLAWYGNNWLWQWVLIMFILLFLLLEGQMLTRRIVEIFGPSQLAQSKAVAALSEMARQVRIYLVGRTIVNFGLALIVGVVYYSMGLRQPWTWALLTAVLCYVPYLGPILAGVPPVLDAFVSCPSPWYALGLIVFYIAIVTFEGYIVVPVVMGRSMELNATTVMLSCLFWELVWGLPGLFLAMPLMAAVKAICVHVPGWRPWANLMGTREEDAAFEEELEAADPAVLIETAGSNPGNDKYTTRAEKFEEAHKGRVDG
jgi:predicted PurR-regulated permease PerM